MANRRRTVALIMDYLESGPYQSDLLAGAHRAAAARDANLLALPSSALVAGDRPFANWSLGLGGPSAPDALVLASATVRDDARRGLLAEGVRRCGPVPAVSIGEALPGIPALLLDNRDAFPRLLDHLFGHHGYRNPLFVAGPPSSFDAAERLGAFREALARHGIADGPDRVLPGNFQFSGGRAAARSLWPWVGDRPDVVVCANDNTAFGVLHEFLSRGLRVPQDVAVTGFDDVAFSAWIESPLTTVRQPIAEFGERAVLGVLDGEAGVTGSLPTSVVYRGSCGCPGPSSEEQVRRHLSHQLSWYAQTETSLVLEGLLADFALGYQETGRPGGLEALETSILEALEVDWWYLCLADPGCLQGPQVPEPSVLHVVRPGSRGFDGPVRDPGTGAGARFPDHLGLTGRWTALQIDLTVGPRGDRQFGTLTTAYRPGFRDRYELLRNRLSEAVAGLAATQRLRGLNQALQEAGRRLEELSVTDELTGCPNRRGFLTLGTRELASCRRQGRGLGVFFLDLDGLKRVNDQWGHEAGDQAIRAFARILGRTVRDSDLMARLGGDEFTVLAPGASEGADVLLRHRIDALIEAFHRESEEPWRLAYSLGAVFSVPGDRRTLSELLSQADARLYGEKDRKRGR